MRRSLHFAFFNIDGKSAVNHADACIKVKMKWQVDSLATKLLEYFLLLPLPLEAVEGAFRGGFVTGE